MRPKPIIILILLFAIASLVTLMSSLTLAQATGKIVYGETVSGVVTNRFGEEWAFQGCQNDVITITAQSSDFSPYLELYGSYDEDALIEAESAATELSAAIGGYSLTGNGTYTVVVMGSRIRDRGLYSLTLSVSTTTSAVEAAMPEIFAGQRLTGEVTSRFGSEWLFYGCANEVVTFTLESDAFVPYLEVYGPSGRDPLTASIGISPGLAALIGAFALPEQGIYTLIAAGENVSDRGIYTLGVAVAGSQWLTDSISATATLTPTSVTTTTTAVTPTSVTTMTSAVTPTATAIPASGPLCVVTVPTLNLRRGPGTNYETYPSGLIQGMELRPIARDADGNWIEVEVVGRENVGWVSASVQYISCTGIAIMTLPVGVMPQPPTPTFTPVPSPTPTSSPTPQPLALQPRGLALAVPGGDPGDVEGDLYIDPNYLVSLDWDDDDGAVEIRDRLYLELFVYDSDPQNLDGDDAERVEFEIDCPNGEEYFHSESTARYCSFGGGEPDCTVAPIQLGANLPGSSCAIENGRYDVTITAYPFDHNAEETVWLFDLYFQLPEDDFPEEDIPEEDIPEENQEPPPSEPTPEPAPPPSADVFANIVQVGSGSTLIFQVEAYDPNVGTQDGDGIDHVDFTITGPSGTVYSRREGTAHYCAFGGGEPDCNGFNLAENSNWPDGGPQIEPGTYELFAEAVASDGRSQPVSTSIEIE